MIATATISSVIPSAYSPAALLTAFGNSIASPLLNKIFTVKGIYKAGKGVSYNGVYYDSLKDELSDASITLLTPEQLRPSLHDGQVILVSVYLSKRFQATSARIEIQLMINELLSRQEKVMNEDETKALALIQQKAKAGFKDADSFIKRKLFEQQPIAVTILIGQSAIIDQDILHQLKDAAIAFETRFVRINLALVDEITRGLQTHQETDILVIARGGGENINIFDDPEIAAAALTLKPILLTALGHSADEPLLQKVADKALITPTALGQYFHDLYTRTLEDLQGSKAKLIKDLTQQIDLNYQQKIQGLQLQVAETRRVNRILTIAVCGLLLFLLIYWGKHA